MKELRRTPLPDQRDRHPAFLATPGSAIGSGRWLLGPNGAQELIGAAFADPGRGRHLAGRQADAGGALAGDQLPHPGASVARRAAAVAGSRAVVGCGQLRPVDRRRRGIAVDVQVTGVVGIYSNPNHVMAYDDGEVRQQCSICFTTRMLGGQLATSSETKEVRFVDPADLAALNIHPSMRLRIDHYLERRSAPYIG
jgi:hypothetical protein